MKHSQAFQDLLEKGPEKTEGKAQVPEVIAEAIDSTETLLAPTDMEKSILEKCLQGVSVSQISYGLSIPEGHVRTYLRNPKVKAYLKELKEAVNEIDQLMLTGTLRKIVGARIEEVEEGDAGYAALSNKDTLDVIKVFADITNSISKGQEKSQETNVFATIYQQVLGN